MEIIFILPALSAALMLALGLLALLRGPRHPSNSAFAAACAAAGLAEAGNFLMLWSGSPAGPAISAAGQALMPAAWLLFASALGRTERGAPIGKKPLIAALAAAGLFFSSGALFGWPVPFNAEIFGRYFNIFLILGLTLTLIHLESALRLSASSSRPRIKYMVLGAGSLLAFHIYAASQALLFDSVQADIIAVVSAATVLSSCLMAWAVIKERLFETDVSVSRKVLYNSFAALLIGVYLLSVGAFTQFIEAFSGHLYFSGTLFAFTAILGLAALLASSTLSRKLELFISRNFYRHKYEFKDKWMEATSRISSRLSTEEICATLAEMVVSTTGSRRVWIWLKDPATGAFKCPSPCLNRVFAEIPPAHALIRVFESGKGAFFPKDVLSGRFLTHSEAEELKGFSTSIKAALITPLEASRELVGFMAQDPDRSGADFDADDLDFLRAVSTQAAVQIKNIRLNEDITAAKEAEVFHRMSSFIMHDLKNLTNSLSLVSRNARSNINNPEFQADAIRTIDLTVSRMKALIGRLTEPPAGAALSRTDTDLGSVIDAAIKKASLNNLKGASFINDCGFLPVAEIDPEAIETVLYNLLTNAYEAIGLRGEVRLSSVVSHGAISITVSDNGTGIPREFMERSLFKPFRTTKKSGFGVGLCQCKAIVEAHGGFLEARSTEGKGSSFTMTLPSNPESMVV